MHVCVCVRARLRLFVPVFVCACVRACVCPSATAPNGRSHFTITNYYCRDESSIHVRFEVLEDVNDHHRVTYLEITAVPFENRTFMNAMVSPVPVQMWAAVRPVPVQMCQGEPSPGAGVGRVVSPVPAQM